MINRQILSFAEDDNLNNDLKFNLFFRFIIIGNTYGDMAAVDIRNG